VPFLKTSVALAAILSGMPMSQAQAQVDALSQLDTEEITVIGTDQSRYIIKENRALTGFQLDYLELPRIVNLIPEQLILDQKIVDLSEALRNTPGITQSDGFGGTNDDFLIRGFRRNVVYRNGFRRGTNFRTNLSNLEYIQVVRGPASITYGQVEPGGLVDVVTKKPLDERRISGEIRYGSFDDLLVLADWSQPITDDLAVRLVASTQDANSFRHFTDISRDTVALSARWDVTDGTRLDLAYEFRDESRPLDRGTVTVRTGADTREIVNNLLDVPISRRFGEPFEIFESEFHFVEATLEQDFSDDWAARLGVAYESSAANDIQARPRSVVILNADAPISADGFFLTTPAGAGALVQPFFDDPTDRVFLARRTDGSLERDTEVFYLNGVVSGEFQTAGLRHRVAIGGDFREIEQTRFFVTTPTTNGFPEDLGGNGPLFDIQNPIYGNLIENVPTDGLPLRTSGEVAYGFFLNDYINLTDKLSVLLGLRYDEVKLNGDLELDAASALSPQFAVNYQALDTVSVFFSYAQAFEPNFVADLELGVAEPFDPEDSEQFEFGVKVELFDGQMQASAAVYRINKSNVLVAVDGVPELRDGQRSQGFELSATGQPIPGMNVTAGYAFNDSELRFADDTPLAARDGNRPRNVGKHTFNLWTSYEVQSGLVEGLGVGGGVFYTSDRFGDDGNTYSLGAYTLVDLTAWYTLQAPGLGEGQNIRVQVALKNLFDEDYFPASGGNERINIGTPRTVFGSISLDF
jgi:iron complex outermembrane receptor protein